MNVSFPHPEAAMRRALELAERGRGAVEPNPPVGAVIVDRHWRLIGEGWHERFGGPHAEVQALRAAGEAARGCTLLVTLEPCNHYGQTPPCTAAIEAAGIQRVIVATTDPAQHTAQSGVDRLREHGISVEVGLLEDEARRLLAPFHKLVTTGRPFVHAKWAMTLDGKIATHTGDSQWISSEDSRAIVHQLRGRMDAIIAGIGTVLADNPRLTARPPGPRVATRIVLDRSLRLPLHSQLAGSLGEAPLIVCCSAHAPAERSSALKVNGVELLELPIDEDTGHLSWDALLVELGRRRMTNILIEGGSETLGTAFDADIIDWIHVFIAPKLVGGTSAPSPVGGRGSARIVDAARLNDAIFLKLRNDIYVQGRLDNQPPT